MRALLIIAMLTLAAAPADAQRRRGRAAVTAPAPRFGGHVGYNFDVDEVVLGAQLSYPMTSQVELYPSFDYYFVEGSLWSLNLDLKVHPPTRAGALYFGGGLAYTRAGDGAGGSSTGLNLLAGLEGRRRATVPYVEAKLVLADQSAFQLVGGFSFSFR